MLNCLVGKGKQVQILREPVAVSIKYKPHRISSAAKRMKRHWAAA